MQSVVTSSTPRIEMPKRLERPGRSSESIRQKSPRGVRGPSPPERCSGWSGGGGPQLHLRARARSPGDPWAASGSSRGLRVLLREDPETDRSTRPGAGNKGAWDSRKELLRGTSERDFLYRPETVWDYLGGRGDREPCKKGLWGSSPRPASPGDSGGGGPPRCRAPRESSRLDYPEWGLLSGPPARGAEVVTTRLSRMGTIIRAAGAWRGSRYDSIIQNGDYY